MMNTSVKGFLFENVLLCLGEYVIKNTIDWNMELDSKNPLVKAYYSDKSKNYTYFNKVVREYILKNLISGYLCVDLRELTHQHYVLHTYTKEQLSKLTLTNTRPDLVDKAIDTLSRNQCTLNHKPKAIDEIEFLDNDLIDDMVQQLGCAIVMTINREEKANAETVNKQSKLIREMVDRQGYYAFNNYSFLVKRPGNYSFVLFVTDVPQEYIFDWIKAANTKRYLRTPEQMMLKRMADLTCSDETFDNVVNCLVKSLNKTI